MNHPKSTLLSVVKSNKLIDAGYSLPAREQIFVLYLISEISMEDEEFKEWSMHWKEIEKLLNFDGKRRISHKDEVFDLMDRLNASSIRWENDKEVGQSAWISSMTRNKKTDVYRFQLSASLRPYLLQLKEHFTKFQLKYIVYLKAKHIRFYELMKRHEFQREFELTVERIRFCLGYEPNKYKTSYDFKRYVLERAQKELEEYTDIKFDFEVAQKKGKTPISYRFRVFKNVPNRQYEAPKLLGETLYQNPNQINLFTAAGQAPYAVEELTLAQHRAYIFLSEQGVNKQFILSTFLRDPILKYEMAVGYEDHFARVAFQLVKKKSKIPSKAAAFVTWWKKGLLLRPDRKSKFIDAVVDVRRELSQEKLDNRRIAATMTRKEFLKQEARPAPVPVEKQTKQLQEVQSRMKSLTESLSM